MKDFYNYLNEIPTTLEPITKEKWFNKHKWIYDEIAKKINDSHIVDVGCGCGLLGIYLVWSGIVKTADLYDAREPQITYAQDLVNHIGLQDKITIHKKYLYPNDISDSTIIATRFGSLYEFEKFIFKNKLITVRRTSEVEPLFIREQLLPWNINIVQRYDGFKLEILQYSYDDLYATLNEGRWVENLNPKIPQFLKDCNVSFIEKHEIGDDYIV